LANKDKFSIKTIGSVSGYRRDSTGVVERFPYVGMMIIELYKLKPQNFVDRFITPYLSFYYDKKDRLREKKSHDIANEIREFIKKQNYKNRYKLVQIDIGEVKAGDGKSDLKIGLQSNDEEKALKALQSIKESLYEIKGITTVSDSIHYGIDEIKLKVNSYGESLGISEKDIGILLSNAYLENRFALAFDKDELLELRIRDKDKDSLSSLKHFTLTLPNGERVALKDVCDFEKKRNFEKVIKDFGVKNFYIYANVDSNIITASQALKKIDPLLKEIEKEGIKINLKGESEKRKDLKSDMMAATTLAIILITLSLLYLFNSFKETLMMLSVIPFSILGVLLGHIMLGLNLSMPSIIGILGLSGIVINDGIIMVMTLKEAKSIDDIYRLASSRLRPIILTSVTTLIGLMTLIFFPTGQAAIFQPMAVALGFGLAWGTVLNLLYLPALYTLINRKQLQV
jgi:multidrug efflux pump subunit AcrB